MEKFSQFRDRGSGIAPFFPLTPNTSSIYVLLYSCFFLLRLPFFIISTTIYFLFLQWLPLGPLFRKILLWIILGISGIWWMDLQIDGVKKGSLAKKHAGRVPGPSDIVASSFASPIDAVYLAAIFDPIFTISYPHTHQIKVISTFGAIFRAFSTPEGHPARNSNLTDIGTLVANNKRRVIIVFPECTTTNGKGILPCSPSLLASPETSKIFPLHLRYTPSDITTPIPGQYILFLWNLLSRPTHSIRVRIAAAIENRLDSLSWKPSHVTNQYNRNSKDTSKLNQSSSPVLSNDQQLKLDSYQKDLLARVGESLARLGMVKRVGLTVTDKLAFIKAWKQK
ncbi:vacuolar protein sorting protein Vps66 [Blumeria hordei DH14]|uniref:Vacuolar protein sorting protein Vps66 n=1 Tax=Blumeria graminis f. sp. hordei (strain DH14) TaxID=546991 RepID=N1JM56_BLUG1|nr:vacuolar protein sorting protein Vps66 [Blumeria hordei DH14]